MLSSQHVLIINVSTLATKHSRPCSNCVKVRPKLAQPAYLRPTLEPLVVSTGFVERFHPSNDAIKRDKPFIETFVQMLVRSGRSSSRVGFQFIKEIGAIRACFHRHLKKKKDRLRNSTEKGVELTEKIPLTMKLWKVLRVTS